MNERRDRFRQAMARFEPSGDPLDAIKHGFYVQEPGQSLAQQILARLELRPHSSHLVAGAIGSGKTTQLRVLEDDLRSSKEFLPLFIDVNLPGVELHRPGKLIEYVRAQIETIQIQRMSPDEAKLLVVLGLVGTLLGNGQSQHSPRVDAQGLQRKLASLPEKLVLILDSLDRSSLTAFSELCEGDIKKLRSIVALVIVGPPAVMYGAAREVVDRFAYFSRQPTHDPGKTHAFLVQILRTRADESLLPDDVSAALVAASGGILRDLVALTQSALEEAYVAGHAGVELPDVKRAIDAFGRKHIIGIDSDELATLQRVRTRGVFVRTKDSDASLLITRRVLEYADEHGATRFVIHPTLIPLLEQLADP
jgi:Cdc6-like AAA superfamily ATPase